MKQGALVALAAGTALAAGAAIAATLAGCPRAKQGADAVVFEPSPFDAKRVAIRVASTSFVTDSRGVVCPQTRDPGHEMKVQAEGAGGALVEGTFKIYKAPSEKNLKAMVQGVENLLRSMNALSKKKVTWCYLTGKDFFFDCQLMPPELQEEFKQRFLKVLEKPPFDEEER